MRKYLFVFLCFLMHVSVAQTTTVQGKVTEEITKLPLQSVIVTAGNRSAITDSAGTFEMSLSFRPNTLVFKRLGYETLTKAIADGSNAIFVYVMMEIGNSNLDEVVVTASKFEQKISEVTSSLETLKPKLVEASGNINMQTAVEQVSGVNVVKGQVNIRGGSGFSYGAGSRVLMLIDDLPILSPEAGDIKWDFLPTENIQQVEVIKGASSALFGSSALGGVINIRTASPKEKPETKIRVFTGMYDNYAKLYYNFNTSPIFNHGLYLNHSRKIGNHDLTMSGALVLDNQYRKDENTSYGRITTNYRYHFKKVQGLLGGVNINFYKQHTQNFLIWLSDSNPSIPREGTITRQYNTRFSVDPFLTYTTPKGHRHSFRNRYYYNDNEGIDSRKNDYRASFIYNEYQYQKAFGDTIGNELKLILGASNSYSAIHSDSIYGNKTSDNAASYLQIDYKLKKVLFSVGTRAEYFRVDTLERRFIKVLRAGLNWHVFKATYIRASVGEGYRMPSIAELYASTSSGSLNIFPNSNLQPESGWGAEIALKQGFMFGKFKGMADVAAFRTRYSNMIEFIFNIYPPYPGYFGNPLPYLGFKALNYTNARISGVEASLAAEGKIGATKVALTGGYTYINPLNLDSLNAINPSDRFLKYRNNHLVRFNADFEYRSLSFGATVRYNSFMTNIDDIFNQDYFIKGVKRYRELHANGDLIFDLRVSYKIKKYNSTFAFILKNVTNHEYMYAPANLGAPRYFMIQYIVVL